MTARLIVTTSECGPVHKHCFDTPKFNFESICPFRDPGMKHYVIQSHLDVYQPASQSAKVPLQAK